MVLPTFIPNDVEADDAIASLVELHKNTDLEITIISGDKDLYNILYSNVRMLRAKKGVSEFIEIDANFVRNELDINPEDIPNFMAITGDTSDNIPGVKGIGPKGATKLIQDYKTLEGIYQAIDSIKPDGTRNKLLESRENAFLSRDLATLKKDVVIPFSIDTTDVIQFIQKANLEQAFQSRNLKAVYEEWMRLSKTYSIHKIDAVSIPELPILQNYTTITTKSQWQEIEKELKAIDLLCVDTETTSISPMEAKLLGISIAYKKGEHYFSAYLPCIFETIPTKQDDSANALFDGKNNVHQYSGLPRGAETLLWIKSILENPAIPKIGQNIKYDWIVLRQHGVLLAGIQDDTMLLSYILNPYQKSHGLDYLALVHLGHKNIEYKDLVGTGKNTIALIDVPLEQLSRYACEDAEVTLRLYEILKASLQDPILYNLYTTLDKELIYPILRMEENGISLDTEHLSKLRVVYESRLKEVEEQIYHLANEVFNIASPNELRKILFDKMQIHSKKKTETGLLSTDQKILESLISVHPIIKEVLEHRSISKLLSTYIVPLPTHINTKTNRIHTSFLQTGVATGRLASTNPNLQNIPVRGKEGKEMRQAFIANKDHLLLSFDYSQIELRVLAHYSKDPNLIKAYQEDQDIHDQATYFLFKNKFNKNSDQAPSLFEEEGFNYGVDIHDMDSLKKLPIFKEYRSQAKALNFSIVYGATSWGISQNLGISRHDAQALIDSYFHAYPNVKKYMVDIIEITKQKGYSENLFGRRRPIDGLESSLKIPRDAAERLAINNPIQSTAADIIKMAMISIQKELDRNNYQTKMLLQIHDELLFEVPIHEKETIYSMIQNIMENIVTLDIPLKVSGAFGKNWDETKE